MPYDRILCLDPAWLSGVAWTPNRGLTIHSSRFEVDTKTKSRPENLLLFGRWLRHKIKSTDAEFVTFEDAATGGVTHFATLRVVFGLITTIELVCEELQIPYLPVKATDVKNHVLGPAGHARSKRLDWYRIDLARALMPDGGNPAKHKLGQGAVTKYAMFQMAKKRGWKPRDYNESDALWQLDFILTKIKAGEL